MCVDIIYTLVCTQFVTEVAFFTPDILKMDITIQPEFCLPPSPSSERKPIFVSLRAGRRRRSWKEAALGTRASSSSSSSFVVIVIDLIMGERAWMLARGASFEVWAKVEC